MNSMCRISNKISFSTPLGAQISMSDYIASVKYLIQEERRVNPTVVLHTDDEIRSKYTTSIVALSNDREIVGNSSIYPTKMKPFDTLTINGRNMKVGETGSTIIRSDFRGMKFGKQLASQTVENFMKDYDMIVGATVNEIMYSLRIKQGFQQIPFPKELYEEGEIHLAPLMKEGEFRERAKCIMLNITLIEEERRELIALLQKEYI